MTGEDFKKWLQLSKDTRKKMAIKTGVPEPTIYWLQQHGEKDIQEKYVKAFVDAGYIEAETDNLGVLKKLIKLLEMSLANERAEKEIYKRIVMKGIVNDHLYFDAVAAKIDVKKLKALLANKR